MLNSQIEHFLYTLSFIYLFALRIIFKICEVALKNDASHTFYANQVTDIIEKPIRITTNNDVLAPFKKSKRLNQSKEGVVESKKHNNTATMKDVASAAGVSTATVSNKR